MPEPATTVSTLGATPLDDGVQFAVWTGGDAVDLCLFDDANIERQVRLQPVGDGVHAGFVPGVLPGTRYGFRAHGPWNPATGERYNPAKLLLDPYARAIDGEIDHTGPVTGHASATSVGHAATASAALDGHDLRRDDRDSAPYVPMSVVVAPWLTAGYDWGTDAPPRTAWADTVIYEAHVRGLTRLHPAVPDNERGTYAGLAHPAVIEHLLRLGVTAVELLPVHHFVTEAAVASRLLRNYWGYSSIGFFAPHTAYASRVGRGQQVGEFKDMVAALHRAGLEVILDVVYNHTAESDELGPTLSLRGLGNREYYRLRDGGRRYDDTTGCGNTLDLTRPRTLQLVLDSLRYWVRDMHVDGFRFDLAPALARTGTGVDMAGDLFAALRADPVLREAKLIAEPWDIGPHGYQLGNFPPEWTEWNDKYRDTVRDFWRGAGHGVRDVAYRLSGSSDLYRDDGRHPHASINFVTAHDGFTLRDVVSYDRKHNDANGENGADGTAGNRSWNCGVEGSTTDPEVLELRGRQLRNLVGTLLLSTGVPMLVAGDELGRTQHGNNNAYCQDNEISWVDWVEAESYAGLRSFVERVTALRHRHAALRQPHFFDGHPVEPGGPKDLTWLTVHGDEMSVDAWHDEHLATLGLLLSGAALRQREPDGSRAGDDSFLMWLHAGADPVYVRLPDLEPSMSYVLELDTGDEPVQAGDLRVLPSGSTLMLRARTLVLLRVPRSGPR